MSHDDLSRLTEAVDRALAAADCVEPAQAAPLLVDIIALAHDVAVEDGSGVAAVAAATHRTDGDDIHWASITHPGSIIWPVATVTREGVSGRDALRAAAVGYEVTVQFAGLIATAGITRWHRTAIAGQAGAAATAAFLTGAPLVESIALSLTTASGIGQTIIERASAGAYHRACAARNGVDAAAMAAGGLRAPIRVLSGEAGLLAACGADDPLAALDRWSVDGSGPSAIATTSLRIYPTNGFAQAAVAGAAELARAHDLGADAITVKVHPAVAQQFTGPIASRHWDLLAAVAATVETGDPWACGGESTIPATLVADDPDGDDPLRPGDATVEVNLDGQSLGSTTRREFAHPSAGALATAKWRRCGIGDPERALDVAVDWLGSPERLNLAQLTARCGPMT